MPMSLKAIITTRGEKKVRILEDVATVLSIPRGLVSVTVTLIKSILYAKPSFLRVSL